MHNGLLARNVPTDAELLWMIGNVRLARGATRALIALFVTAIATAGSDRATAEDRSVASIASIAQWTRFEASYTPDVAPANPLDPDEIDVRAEPTTASTRET